MMNKRDLLADLKVCDRATPGPWRYEWNPDYSEIYAQGVDTPSPIILVVGHDPYDADFIVQAREGWPHAIERALKAEALAQELLDVLGRVISRCCRPRYLVGRLELDLDSVLEDNGLLKKAKEVLRDD